MYNLEPNMKENPGQTKYFEDYVNLTVDPGAKDGEVDQFLIAVLHCCSVGASMLGQCGVRESWEPLQVRTWQAISKTNREASACSYSAEGI